MTITVRTNKGDKRAHVIKENKKTVWVQLPDGNIVKRHKAKHVLSENGRSPFGPLIIQ